MFANKAAVTALFTTMNMLFNKAFKKAEPIWPKIAMRVPSTTSEEAYGWLSNFPRMVRWVGDKSKKQLKAFKYAITNDDWEATIEVDRNDIEDDKTGQYGVQATASGDSAALWPDEMVAEAVVSSFTAQCFDGQFFCDTDHPVGPEGAQVSVSNKITIKLSADDRASAKASFGVAKTMMRSFKDDEGRSLKCKPTVVLVGPLLEDEALHLMTADKLKNGESNTYKGACEVVVLDEIQDESWFLLDTSKAVKPFVFQERKKPVPVHQTGADSDGVFENRKLKFSVEARGNSGHAFWQLCLGSTGTGL